MLDKEVEDFIESFNKDQETERILKVQNLLVESGITPKFKEGDPVIYIEFIYPINSSERYPYNLYSGAVVSLYDINKKESGEYELIYHIESKSTGWRTLRETFVFFDIEDFAKNALIEPRD